MDNLKKTEYAQYTINIPAQYDAAGVELIITKTLEGNTSNYWYHERGHGIIRHAIGLDANEEYIEYGGKLPDEVLLHYIDTEQLEKEH